MIRSRKNTVLGILFLSLHCLFAQNQIYDAETKYKQDTLVKGYLQLWLEQSSSMQYNMYTHTQYMVTARRWLIKSPGHNFVIIDQFDKYDENGLVDLFGKCDSAVLLSKKAANFLKGSYGRSQIGFFVPAIIGVAGLAGSLAMANAGAGSASIIPIAIGAPVAITLAIVLGKRDKTRFKKGFNSLRKSLNYYNSNCYSG